MSEKKKKHHGLQHRWLVNTFGVIFALGLVCVSAVTASYAAYYYSNMQADLRNRAKSSCDFFSDNFYQDFSDYYQACIAYARTPDEHLDNSSMHFHAHMGYKLVGTFHDSGYKFGTWYDMI